jgi:hypothetical protein
MRWLADGVPITLLCDLAATGDPQSQTISLTERLALDLSAAPAGLLDHDQSSSRHAVKLVAGAKISALSAG